MNYLGVVVPPLVFSNRVSICISTQPRSPIAQQIAEVPFFFQVSEPARKLFCCVQHSSGSKEPGPNIGPACLAHNTLSAIAIVYLHAVKLAENACALRSPIGPGFRNVATLKCFARTTTESKMTSTRRSSYEGKHWRLELWRKDLYPGWRRWGVPCAVEVVAADDAGGADSGSRGGPAPRARRSSSSFTAAARLLGAGSCSSRLR